MTVGYKTTTQGEDTLYMIFKNEGFSDSYIVVDQVGPVSTF